MLQKARDVLQREYEQIGKETGKSWYAHSRPYYSTHSLHGVVVAADGPADLAFVVFKKGQGLDFFDYGIGQALELAGTGSGKKATHADTNLVKAKSTNGSNDYAIEGVGFGYRGSRVRYSEVNADLISSASDADVDAALLGNLPLIDPASLASPPQLQSPFNQEVPMWHGLAPYLSVEFQWDGGTPSHRIGTCDMFPDASAKSELRSSGRPEHINRYVIPEGYMWRRDGVSQSEFVARVVLEETVVCPITIPSDPGDSTVDVTPTDVFIETTCRIFGLEFRYGSFN